MSTEDGTRHAEGTGRSVANPNRVQIHENPRWTSADEGHATDETTGDTGGPSEDR